MLTNILFIFAGTINLAFNKPAEQISTLPGYTADKAVNGVSDELDDYSSTNSTIGTKCWKVDLQVKYTIEKIILYSRVGEGKQLSQRISCCLCATY